MKPGEPVNFPDDQGRQLLARIPEKVRVVLSNLQTWRDLAALSVGITQDSPRYWPMLDALTACVEAYKCNDWPAFWRAAEQAEVVTRSPSKVEGK